VEHVPFLFPCCPNTNLPIPSHYDNRRPSHLPTFGAPYGISDRPVLHHPFRRGAALQAQARRALLGGKPTDPIRASSHHGHPTPGLTVTRDEGQLAEGPGRKRVATFFLFFFILFFFFFFFARSRHRCVCSQPSRTARGDFFFFPLPRWLLALPLMSRASGRHPRRAHLHRLHFWLDLPRSWAFFFRGATPCCDSFTKIRCGRAGGEQS